MPRPKEVPIGLPIGSDTGTCSFRPSFPAMPDPDLDHVDKQITTITTTLQRIARQRGVIEKARALKVDARKSERVLTSMQQALGDLRAIRRLIEDDLTDAKKPPRRF
jgi:hypothetical protein